MSARRRGRRKGTASEMRRGAPMRIKAPVPRRIRRTKGGLNSKLHATCDGQARPLVMRLTEGQTSNYKGTVLMFDGLPKARALLGERGYDAVWFRSALIAKGIAPCIPSKANRKIQIPRDRNLYRSATASKTCSAS